MVLPVHSGRFQGPFFHGPGPVLWPIIGGNWNIVISHPSQTSGWPIAQTSDVWDPKGALAQYVMEHCGPHTKDVIDQCSQSFKLLLFHHSLWISIFLCTPIHQSPPSDVFSSTPNPFSSQQSGLFYHPATEFSTFGSFSFVQGSSSAGTESEEAKMDVSPSCCVRMLNALIVTVLCADMYIQEGTFAFELLIYASINLHGSIWIIKSSFHNDLVQNLPNLLAIKICSTLSSS